jgi:hypothetical protein
MLRTYGRAISRTANSSEARTAAVHAAHFELLEPQRAKVWKICPELTAGRGRRKVPEIVGLPAPPCCYSYLQNGIGALLRSNTAFTRSNIVLIALLISSNVILSHSASIARRNSAELKIEPRFFNLIIAYAAGFISAVIIL